ncbi:MAG: hypothetical protein JOZ90_04200 [Alphaproteobacteria bacterium]|nr:hypothetical protein [Alphaproteobacteria bacterium]MBV9373194.1 hypothetical protein [Alphaproteobacteria bacterium]MBV9900283.1 hypothetical protein [Alphaproteobacteria bacterium]
MSGGLLTMPAGVQDGTAVPATAFVSPNTHVQTQMGFAATAADVVQFPGPSTVGNWIVPNQHVLIGGVPSIGQGCAGQAIVPGTPPVPSPMTIATPDPHVTGS